ncbi:MAG: hypothetical protein HQK83_07245 [Fibrobacteria bacterium]|nr:hypothetical protein [Fibrobacteria bacterium]
MKNILHHFSILPWWRKLVVFLILCLTGVALITRSLYITGGETDFMSHGLIMAVLCVLIVLVVVVGMLLEGRRKK